MYLFGGCLGTTLGKFWICWRNVEWVIYAAYGKCTVDDLDYLLKSLIHTHNFYGRKPPGPATKSAMVHSQELSAFRDGYTIREIRDLMNESKDCLVKNIAMEVAS